MSGAVALGATTEASTASSGAAVVLGGETQATSGGVDVGTGGWQFGYHGYFRAPFRMGIGKREDYQRTGYITPPDTPRAGTLIPPPGSRTLDANGEIVGRDYDPEEAYKKTTYHIPQIPDDQYLTWQHTNHNSTDWAELFFSVKSSIAEGVVSVEGYNFTQGSFTDPETQFGVAQGFVIITPETPWQNVMLTAKVGTHWNRYGMPGRYDAGEYDTYLFGRTKVTGATLREDLQLGRIKLSFEEGFGGHRPHPSQFNTAKFTLLGHGHAFLRYKGVMAGLHFLHAWAQEEDRDGQGCPGGSGYVDAHGYPANNSVCSVVWAGGPNQPNGMIGGAPDSETTPTVYPVGGVSGFGKFADGADGNVWLPDGSMTIVGPEIKWETGPFGLIYLGYSLINAKNALTVAPAVELLHANGGGEFGLGVTNNYLDNPACNTAKGECSSGGTGKVHTIDFQYEFSLMNLKKGLEDGSRFWGEGRDLVVKLYAMYNKVSSDYDVRLDGTNGSFEPYGGLGQYYLSSTFSPYLDYGWREQMQTAEAAGEIRAGANWWEAWGDNYSDHSKLKMGADIYGSLFSNFAAGLRYDHVSPNNNIPQQAFSILSPRLEFRSRWVTREKIVIQYSRYMYAKRACDMMTPYDPNLEIIGTSANFDYSGSPQNFTGMPLNQQCVQLPSGPRLPDGWGATALETAADWRGAPVTGGNPNQTLPDENVIKIEASMWW